MKKYFLMITCMFALGIILFPQKTYSIGAYIPFGGKVTNTQYCNDGFLLTITTPRGGLYFVPYQVAYRYRQYTVGIPNIKVLGLALTIPYTCTLGNTVQGVGFYTYLIGSSCPSL